MRQLIALMLGLSTMIAAFAADEQEAPALAVVRTWHDLLAQPALDLGDGLHVRLGLESTTCGAGSGVLVYCLADDVDTRALTGEDTLGPVRVVARDHIRLDRVQALRQIREQPRSEGMPLYTRMIPIPALGSCEVRISSVGGTPLAFATIVVTAMHPHPWASFGAARPPARVDGRAMLAACPDGPSACFDLGFVGSCRSIPSSLGLLPIARHIPADHVDERVVLPTALPEAPDPGFKLSWSDGSLVLDSASPLEMSPMDRPFLVRWWLNDRPLVPPDSCPPDELIEGSGQVRGVRRVVLDCDLDRAALGGAVPGDRVGVQVLYCRDGWEYCSEDAGRRMEQLPATAGDQPTTLLSNRLDFILP